MDFLKTTARKCQCLSPSLKRAKVTLSFTIFLFASWTFCLENKTTFSQEPKYKPKCNLLIPGSGRSPGEGSGYPLQYSWASLVAQMVKNPPAMWETWVRSLGWEDPLEEVMAAHPSILAWRIPWTEKPGWSRSTSALMYSFPYLELACCSMPSSNCCYLTCVQISQEAGQVVWYSHLLKNFLHNF